MKTLVQLIVVVAIVVVGVGFYRGWFTVTNDREAENNNVEVKLTVDTDKVKQDTDAVKDGIERKESHNEH